MSHIFDIFGLIADVILWFFEFLTQIFDLIVTYVDICMNIWTNCPPLIYVFISTFVVLAVVMFVWRLIP